MLCLIYCNSSQASIPLTSVTRPKACRDDLWPPWRMKSIHTMPQSYLLTHSLFRHIPTCGIAGAVGASPISHLWPCSNLPQRHCNSVFCTKLPSCDTAAAAAVFGPLFHAKSTFTVRGLWVVITHERNCFECCGRPALQGLHGPGSERQHGSVLAA